MNYHLVLVTSIVLLILSVFTGFLIIKFFLSGRIKKKYCFFIYSLFLITATVLLCIFDLNIGLISIIICILSLTLAAFNFKVINFKKLRLYRFRRKIKRTPMITSRKKTYHLITILTLIVATFFAFLYLVILVSFNEYLDLGKPLFIITFSSLFLILLLSLIIFGGYPEDRLLIIIGDTEANYIFYEAQLLSFKIPLNSLNDDVFNLDYVGIAIVADNVFYRVNYHILRIFQPTTTFKPNTAFSKIEFIPAERTSDNLYYKIPSIYTKGYYGNSFFEISKNQKVESYNEE